KATRGYMPGVIITDGDPAMYRVVLIELPTTRHLFCIWHIKENLKKMLSAKLGAEFDSFYSAFWKCRNSNTNIIGKKWLSTSFVESQNACIKRVLENSNTSLCKIGKVLMKQAENRVNKRKYEDLIRGVSSTTNNITIFPKCVYYAAFRSNIEEVENTPTGEPSGNEFFEDDPDSILVCARFLLDQLDKTNIEEVWKISRITEHNINHIIFCLTDGSIARFSMRLINMRWIPREYRDNALNEHDCFGQRFMDDKQANYSN
ncbi:11347_t:CDS:2, partial [Gigaspora rosea]